MYFCFSRKKKRFKSLNPYGTRLSVVELAIQKSYKRSRAINMFSLENNVIRPRRKATEAWINQHHHHQQQQQNIFNVLEHSNFMPIYDKNRKFRGNDSIRFVNPI